MKKNDLLVGIVVIAIIIGGVALAMFIGANQKSPMTYEETLKEESDQWDSEVKTGVYEMCADNPRSQNCRIAIDRCIGNQSCQEMATIYQLSAKGTPEIDDQAFINASKEYVNFLRAGMGLPPVK